MTRCAQLLNGGQTQSALESKHGTHSTCEDRFGHLINCSSPPSFEATIVLLANDDSEGGKEEPGISDEIFVFGDRVEWRHKGYFDTLNDDGWCAGTITTVDKKFYIITFDKTYMLSQTTLEQVGIGGVLHARAGGGRHANARGVVKTYTVPRPCVHHEIRLQGCVMCNNPHRNFDPVSDKKWRCKKCKESTDVAFYTACSFIFTTLQQTVVKVEFINDEEQIAVKEDKFMMDLVEDTNDTPFAMDDKVEGHSGDHWIPGTITTVNPKKNTYTIRYDNDDYEDDEDKPANEIRAKLTPWVLRIEFDMNELYHRNLTLERVKTHIEQWLNNDKNPGRSSVRL